METLTIEELMKRWNVSRMYLANLRYRGSRPEFLKISGVRYPLKEIEDIEQNNVKLPTPRA